MMIGVVSAALGAALLTSSGIGSRPAEAAEIDPAPDVALKRLLSSQGDSRFTDLNGIHAEYVSAAQSFPFALPKGERFPEKSSLSDPIPGGVWARGGGTAEAYMFWQGATIEAAHTAWSGGDNMEVGRLLDALAAGVSAAAETDIQPDPEGVVRDAIDQARLGNFFTLRGLSPVIG